MTQNLKPLGDRVVVEPIEQDDMTASGLVLPETAKEKPQRGTVRAVGPGGRDEFRICFVADPDGYRIELIDGDFDTPQDPTPDE